jgi:tetratricopeptide (TPR) repeat protein
MISLSGLPRLLMVVIPLVALALRWPAAEFSWQHVDESVFFTLPLEFWSGDLNPGFFNYPTFQFYLTSLAYLIYFALFQSAPLSEFLAYHYFIDPGSLITTARGLTTVMAVGTTIAVMLLGSRIYGTIGGIGAGAILAVMPLHARFSHLAITDTPATLWTTLAALFAVRLMQSGRNREACFAGAFVGLAAATKYPAALSAVPVAVAILMGTRRWEKLALSAATALAFFLLATPYVVLDFDRFWYDFHTMGREHLIDEVHIYGASAWSYHLSVTMRYGLGLLPSVFCALALAWKPRSWRREEIVVASAVLAFGSLLIFPSSVFMRYALPVAPFLALLVVRPLVGLRCRPLLLTAAFALLLAEPAHTTLNTRKLLSGPDTRDLARSWIHKNLENGERLWSPPEAIGRVRLLNPREMYLRHQKFAQRFGAERLARSYQLLLARKDLPPIHGTGNLNDLDIPTSPFTALDSATVLLYRHPLHAERSIDEVPASGSRVITFSPGPLEESIFDWVDWYFLPVGGSLSLSATGPEIEVWSLPMSEVQQPIPSAGAFIRFLAGLLEANQMRLGRDWSEIAKANERLLATPFPIQDFLTSSVRYALHFDLAVAYGHLDRHTESIPHWKKAIAAQPLPDAYIGLGGSYMRLEMAERAANSFERALSLAPDHPQAKALREKLRFLAR